jgi:hypothetical protein
METLTDDLCEIDDDWERSAEVKSNIIVSIGPYSEILKERKKERKKERGNLDSERCKLSSRKGRSSTTDFIRAVQSLHYATVKRDQCRDLTMPLTKTFVLGFEHTTVNVQNLIFLFNKN